jgi:hypothetical protein
MDAPATLVWIAPQPPDDGQSRSIAAWARAHGTRVAPAPDEPPPVLAVDLRIADEVEQQLDKARDGIAARDADGVDRALAAAESRLRAHPALPQASWLMAEVERTRSTRFRRVPPVDVEAADRAWARAEALDGGRVAGAGEEASPAHPEAATVTLDPAPGADGDVWFDGVPAGGAAIATRAGPHSVVVTSPRGPVWASWIETPAGSSSVHVAAPSAPACSSGDVARARLVDGVVVANGVRCAEWIAAAPTGAGTSLLVASCEADHCGPMLPWRAPPPWTFTPPPEHVRHPWPAWATWTLVGAGAVVVTGIVVVASGVLQSPAQKTQFVSGGVKPQ